MDKLDREILVLVQKNASLSVAQVAEVVGISKSACWRRIQKLEEAGVILERVTLLNQAMLNLPLTVYISVRTNQHNDQWMNKFNTVLQGIPEVLEIHRMSGDLKKIIKADLHDVSSSFVMETTKQTTQLPLKYV